MAKFAQVAVVGAAGALAKKWFDYQNNLDARAGDLVQVPFGAKKMMGVVCATADSCEVAAKPLLAKLDLRIPAPLLRSILQASEYFWGSPALFLRAALPKMIAQNRIPAIDEKWVRGLQPDFPARGVKQKQLLERLAAGECALADLKNDFSGAVIKNLADKNVIEIFTKERVAPKFVAPDFPELNPEQQQVLTQIQNSRKPNLLFGVTGSGKTEIYLHLVAAALDRGKSALVLVPEIALTPQMIGRFTQYFPGQVAVLHSQKSDGERARAWVEIARSLKKVILGTRSAIFAPAPELGVIVLDEYHDESYRQDGARPFYDARQVAQLLAQNHDCTLVLGSATPRAEDFLLAQK